VLNRLFASLELNYVLHLLGSVYVVFTYVFFRLIKIIESEIIDVCC